VPNAKLTRIFVAENSDFLREALLRCLSGISGAEVAGHASGGNAAITAIREVKPDIVLLDLMMPQGDGFAVLEAIKPTDHRPFFVVLTMHSQPAFREHCRAMGAHVFLDKATEIERLLDALHALAGQDFELPELIDAFSQKPQTVL
jgi:DNA-binding NarL/FixJ family response regulator